MPGRLLGFVSGRRPSFSPSDLKHPLRDANSCSSSSSSLKAEVQERKASMDHLKLPHLTKHHPDKKTPGHASPNHEPLKPAKLDMVVESPPLVSYNSPAHSSGALFSALLKVDVTANEVLFESFEMQLFSKVNIKKPVSSHCPDCTTQTTELKKWVFAKEPLRLPKGEHRFPFSYLFSGDLPATTHASLAQLDYQFVAVAKTSTGGRITYDRTVKLARSILPGSEKHSIRVFPPTNLTANVTMTPFIHPIGEFPIHLRLAGITTRQNGAQVRWRVRKMIWRIEEHQKVRSPACPKHQAKVSNDSGGIIHEDTRVIGENEVSYYRTPWKTDFDAGEVEAEFHPMINPTLKPVCDVDTPSGLSVTHTLVIEMVVAEEWAPNRRPHQATPTGAARILRMSFHLYLTERAGMGISWDEETPPVYEDVPASPPGYHNTVEDFDLAELEGQIDDFVLNEPVQQPPSSRPTSWAGPGSGEPSRLSLSQRLAASASSQVRSASGSRSRIAITADDLLSEPNIPRRRSADDTRPTIEEDLQPGTVS